MPAARMRLRRVPLATSRWSGIESHALAFLDHDEVAAALARDPPVEFLEHPDNLPAAQYGERGHQTSTST